MKKDVNGKQGMNGKAILKTQKYDENPGDNFDKDIGMLEAELYNWLIMNAYPAADSRQTKKSKIKNIKNHKSNRKK